MKDISILILLMCVNVYSGTYCTEASDNVYWTVETCPYGPGNISQDIRDWTNNKADGISTYYDSIMRSQNKILIGWTANGTTNSSSYVGVHIAYIFKSAVPTNHDSCMCITELTNTLTLGHLAYPHVPGCEGFDTNPVIDYVECFELGYENPDLPKNNGAPTENGVWVKLIYHFEDNPGALVTEYKVISGGCSGVSVDGKTLRARNAKDTCIDTVVDGVNQQFCSCLYNGTVLTGTCSHNGIDTSCGGQLPFYYNNRSDSIVNDCRFNEQRESNIDSLSPDQNDSSRDVSQDNFTDGLNKLLQQEKLNNNELKGINDYLKSIYLTLVAFAQNTFNNIKEVSGGLDSLHEDLTGSDTSLSEEMTNGIDTSLSEVGSYDTGEIMSKIRNYMNDSTLQGDTNISAIDTNEVNELFSQFKMDIDTSNCDCDPEWFSVDFMGTPIIFDICQYPIVRDTVKIIVDILSIFFLSVFSFKMLFKTINDLFI